LTGERESVIRELRLTPAVLVRKHAVEEPIPVLREIGSRRVEKAYSIGLSNAGNDFPPEVMGSLHRLSYGTGGGRLAFNKKGLRNNRPFLLVRFQGRYLLEISDYHACAETPLLGGFTVKLVKGFADVTEQRALGFRRSLLWSHWSIVRSRNAKRP
jgi:hypothetical protein